MYVRTIVNLWYSMQRSISSLLLTPERPRRSMDQCNQRSSDEDRIHSVARWMGHVVSNDGRITHAHPSHAAKNDAVAYTEWRAVVTGVNLSASGAPASCNATVHECNTQTQPRRRPA